MRSPTGRADVSASAIGTPMACVDADGAIAAWGPAAQRLSGHPPEAMVGRAARDLLAADLPTLVRRRVAKREPWSARLALRHSDGRTVDVSVRAFPMRGPQGDIVWVMTAADPEGAARRDDLAELEAWAFDQLPISLGVYDHENRLVRANDEGLRAMGTRQDEVLGLRLGEVVPGPPYDQVEKRMAEVLRTGATLTEDVFARTPGETRAHAWSILLYPLNDPVGKVRGVCLAARDVTEQFRSRQRLALVNEAGARIGTTLDVVRTAQELADVAVGRFADFVSIDVLESVFRGQESDLSPAGAPTVFCRAAQQSVFENCPESVVELGQTDRYQEDSPMAVALATRMPSCHALDDRGSQKWLAHDPARALSVRRHGIHSLLAVPLLARGTTLGLALFLRHRMPDHFDADDLLLAEEMTARAAVCIDNARRYTHQRNTSLALQRSMLPQGMPEQAAVDVASRYLPAGSQAGVGGDWFDVIPLSGARVALVVGDVVGHGIQASATMGRLRTAVRTLADVDLPPDELLTHLDDMVLRLDREEGSRVLGESGREAGDIGATCLYAVYDPVSRRCTMARAGHPGPALVRPDGTVDFPDLPTGPPLGLGGLPFESAELELAEGTLIALYTDGLIGAAGQDIDLGVDRLRGALARPEVTLERVCDNVLDSLLSGSPTDDVALLVARTHELDASHVATWDLAADPAEVSVARRLATEQLAEWGLDEASFVTELVVSELVTNAIRYAQPPVQLRLIHEKNLICEVADASSTAPHLRRARTFDEGGRGLLLVAQLTQRWGTRHTPTGKVIWAEQTLSP